MYEALIHRHESAVAWQKIPWDDPDFSRRMLREHLSQEHDLASRRWPIIDQSVAWIHENLLHSQPARILDLGCGPGFYTDRFVKLGHVCTGIDFGPASIAYARQNCEGDFTLANVVAADYGEGYDLICMLYGELNAFSPEDAKLIVDKAYQALAPGGALLLEVSHAESIQRIAQQSSTWYTQRAGLFSDEPHIVLEESRMQGSRSESWFYVIDAQTGELSTYVAMHQMYSDAEYGEMLSAFSATQQYATLTGSLEKDLNFFSIVAHK